MNQNLLPNFFVQWITFLEHFFCICRRPQNKLEKIATEIEEIDLKFLFLVTWGSNIESKCLGNSQISIYQFLR